MAEHVHVMPPDIQRRRDRLTALLEPLVAFLRDQDHWCIGPEHLALLDELDTNGVRLRDEIDATERLN